MIWPFPPLNPMIEGLSFSTDRLRAFSSDQRIRLTDIPRRTFNHGYSWTAREYERARAMMRGQLPGPFMVPDWAQSSIVSVSAAATSISFDNTNPALEAGVEAVIVQNSEQYQELNISGASSGGITLGAPIAEDYENALIAPLLECFPSEGLSASRTVLPIRSAEIEWNCYTGEDIADDGGAPTYRGLPVLIQCGRLGEGEIPAGLVHPFESVDNGLAVPFFDTAQEQPIQLLGAAWQPEDRAESYALRQWFHYLKGRQKAFWFPDMNHGLELAANIANGAGSITIKNVGFTEGYGSGDIFIRTLAGDVYPIQVASSTEAGANEVLTLEDPAPAAVDIDDVDELSMMFCVILAADRIEWLHRGVIGPKVVVPVEEVPVPA